jgi:hypothetical protein
VPSFLGLLILSTAASATSQTSTAEVSGVIHDIDRRVLPGAMVVAQHLESGVRIERLTDARGHYLLPLLRVGTYTITAELPGFKRAVRSDITLVLGQQLQLDLVLEVGGLSEEITVTRELPLLQTTTAEISDVIVN